MSSGILLRALLISGGALILNGSVESLAPNALTDVVKFPILVALSPLLVSRLPLMGTKALVDNAVGMQPIFSMLLMIGLSIAVHFVIREIRSSDQTDVLSRFVKDENHMSIGKFKISREFFLVILSTVFFDGIVQYAMKHRTQAKQKQLIENAVVRGMEKYFKKP